LGACGWGTRWLLADSTDDKISQYLNADQKAELQKVSEDRKRDFGKHGFGEGPDHEGPHGPPPGP
jgi:hypothetical protein